MDTPFHHGSHRDLLSKAEPPDAIVHKVDAIIVPSARTAPYLRQAARLAQELSCMLIVLCSKLSKRVDVVAEIDRHPFLVDIVAIDVPASLGEPVPQFATSLLLAKTPPFERKTDTSLKRNLGLLIARMLGWRRVVFLDDDIQVGDPADLRRAVGLLGTHDGVGLAIGGYPDNSVVCHAHRDTGGWQETFVGGGALAVAADRTDSFFPNIYNEDWFFLLDGNRLRPVAETGKAFQWPYDPFATADRARAEELGDVLAEGLFALLDRKRRVQDADRDYWTDFLRRRAGLIADVVRRVEKADIEQGQRGRMIASLKAARGRLELITPDLCVTYLRAWRADRTRWRRCIATLPSQPSIADALRHLGLGRSYSQRWLSHLHESGRKAVSANLSAGIEMPAGATVRQADQHDAVPSNCMEISRSIAGDADTLTRVNV